MEVLTSLFEGEKRFKSNRSLNVNVKKLPVNLKDTIGDPKS